MRAVLPWLAGLAALLVYALTLNGWVSSLNVHTVARTAGWIWQPELIHPLTAVVLWPFGLLPARWIWPALNWFSAGCGALALGLLARSVALLPHDLPPDPNTGAGVVGALGGRAAWIPPVLAVIVGGLQLTFWEQATSATGEMVNLLIVAWLVHSLLEYRLDRKDGRFLSCAFLYAAGIANDWALVVYLPVFLVALMRVKGLAILDARFWRRMGFWAAAGLSLYLLLPILANVSAGEHIGFWPALKANLAYQKTSLSLFRGTGLGPLVLATFVPLMVVSFRWKLVTTQSGDDSPLGVLVARSAIHFVHAACLAVALWTALDAPLSARSLGTAASPLVQDYISALVAAYCAGHFLIVGSEARAGRRGPQGRGAWPDSRRWVRVLARIREYCAYLAAAGACLLVGVAPLALVWRNLGQIRITNGPRVREFARELYDGLPAGKSVALSDDGSELFLLRAEMCARGNPKAAIVVDTRSVGVGEYQQFIARQCETRWGMAKGALGLKGADPVNPAALYSALSTNAPLIYLHPSVDYCFEWFAERPEGSVVRLLPRRANEAPHQRLDAASAAANEHYWQQRWTNSLQALAAQMAQSANPTPEWAGRLRLATEPNRTAVLLGAAYARCLDCWGVRLQRAGRGREAGVWFQRALDLDPASLAAQINLEYNQRRQRGDDTRLPREFVEARFTGQSGRYRAWTAAAEANGPFDEPTSLFSVAATMVGEGEYNLAAAEFARCAQLAPDWLDAGIGLAQIRVILGDYAGALQLAAGLDASKTVRDPMDEAKIVCCRAAALKGLGRGDEAGASVDGFARQHHERAEVLTAAAELYLQCERYGPAVELLDRLLEREPNDANLLLFKGSAELGLGRYVAAIETLTKALELAPSNPAARINRAIASLRAGRFDDARGDYEQLVGQFPNSVPVLYGLAEVAWHKGETNAAIALYKR